MKKVLLLVGVLLFPNVVLADQQARCQQVENAVLDDPKGPEFNAYDSNSSVATVAYPDLTAHGIRVLISKRSIWFSVNKRNAFALYSECMKDNPPFNKEYFKEYK